MALMNSHPNVVITLVIWCSKISIFAMNRNTFEWNAKLNRLAICAIILIFQKYIFLLLNAFLVEHFAHILLFAQLQLRTWSNRYVMCLHLCWCWVGMFHTRKLSHKSIEFYRKQILNNHIGLSNACEFGMFDKVSSSRYMSQSPWWNHMTKLPSQILNLSSYYASPFCHRRDSFRIGKCKE